MTWAKAHRQSVTKLGLGNDQINILQCLCSAEKARVSCKTYVQAVHLWNKKWYSSGKELDNHLSLIVSINQCLFITSTPPCPCLVKPSEQLLHTGRGCGPGGEVSLLGSLNQHQTESAGPRCLWPYTHSQNRTWAPVHTQDESSFHSHPLSQLLHPPGHPIIMHPVPSPAFQNGKISILLVSGLLCQLAQLIRQCIQMAFPQGAEMWERCHGGQSESPVPILTRAGLKSTFHMGLLRKISLKRRVSTAKTIKKKNLGVPLRLILKVYIPHEPISSSEQSLDECTKYLQYTRHSQNAFQSPSATSQGEP